MNQIANELVPAGFVLPDQSGAPYRLADHVDRPVALLFYRGDW